MARRDPAGLVWTNPSVNAFAGQSEPVEAITKYARAVVLKALDAGWSGPPFDQIALADFLGVPVAANDAIRDARTVSDEVGELRIEFNPSRPRGRMRYSLAHEIAHTFFPDCADRVRNRGGEFTPGSDDWQLEALCNIAAAELVMPIGTLKAFERQKPSIDNLLAERERFDVSTEALFIRAARVVDDSCAMFCASRVELHGDSRYRLDYVIGSHSWQQVSLGDKGLAPRDSAVAHCTGIGFTAVNDELWPADAQPLKLHVECVGVPPYPGTRYPRVVGMLWEADRAFDDIRALSPSISYVRGDATLPRGNDAKLIVQVVNDATQNWGGGGFASAVRRVFPRAQEDFSQWWQGETRGKRRLGMVHLSEVSPRVWVASIVAQHGYGESSSPRIRYAALRDGLLQVASFALSHKASLHMPRIGCGQAGGSWHVVEELLRDIFLTRGVTVTVYDPPGARSRASAPVQPSLEL